MSQSHASGRGPCGQCPSDRCITDRAPQREGIRVRPTAVRIGSRRYGRDQRQPMQTIDDLSSAVGLEASAAPT